MDGIEPCAFGYRSHATAASLLWTVWLSVPDFIRLKAYFILEHYGKQTSSPRVVRLPFKLCAKRGMGIEVGEALVTQYVCSNTSIPVPAILDVLPYSDGVYMLMTRLPGRQMGAMGRFLEDVPEAELTVFADTLRDWLAQLRSLGPPPVPDAVCGFMGTSLMSYRISHDNRVGPFESQAVFHSQWYCTLPPQADEDIRALSAQLRRKPYRICLTHGDISPNNILVDNDFKPVGLIDWECAAWMPEYWELAATLYRRQRYGPWVKVFKEALPQYEEELRVEKEQWKYICPF